MTTAMLYGLSGLILVPFNGMLAGWQMLDRLWCGWHNRSPIRVAHAGNHQVEQAVGGPVVGFGRQVGVVEEALQELARGRPGEKLRRVQSMMQAIEWVKEQHAPAGKTGKKARPAFDSHETD